MPRHYTSVRDVQKYRRRQHRRTPEPMLLHGEGIDYSLRHHKRNQPIPSPRPRRKSHQRNKRNNTSLLCNIPVSLDMVYTMGPREENGPYAITEPHYYRVKLWQKKLKILLQQIFEEPEEGVISIEPNLLNQVRVCVPGYRDLKRYSEIRPVKHLYTSETNVTTFYLAIPISTWSMHVPTIVRVSRRLAAAYVFYCICMCLYVFLCENVFYTLPH